MPINFTAAITKLMTDRTILITGCSSGIGLASARMMKARGWRVLATARQPDDLKRLTEEYGLEALYLELADSDAIAACAEEALSRTGGRLYALFNNAAYSQPGAIEDVPAHALRHQLEVNVVGTHDLTRRIIPAMRANGRGRIVQCSSVLGLISAPWRGAYCASKFALEALTDALRLELQGSGIHVSLIEPGPIRPRFVENARAAAIANLDLENSVHRERYRQMLEPGTRRAADIQVGARSCRPQARACRRESAAQGALPGDGPHVRCLGAQAHPANSLARPGRNASLTAVHEPSGCA